MASQKLEKGILNITAALVFVFTLVLGFNLLSFRPSLKQLLSAGRNPAALTTESLSLAKKFPSAKEMEHILPCLQNGESYEFISASPRLRLESQLCRAGAELTDSLILNKTNGFVATVFKLNEKQFTTDLIDLRPGENRIHISHTLANGEKVLAEMNIKYQAAPKPAAVY